MLVTPDLAVQPRTDNQTLSHMQAVKNQCVSFTSILSERPHPQLQNFSRWSAQLSPLILLSDQAFWFFPHLLEKIWTVKGTLPYPTCSNSNALRSLPPSWTELSLLNTKGSWRVDTDISHQKSITSHLKREQRNSMGRTALIPWLVAITVSLVLWEPIFLHYLRRLLLFHSLLTNLWTSKWQLENFLKVSENTFLHCFLLLKKKKKRDLSAWVRETAQPVWAANHFWACNKPRISLPHWHTAEEGNCSGLLGALYYLLRS